MNFFVLVEPDDLFFIAGLTGERISFHPSRRPGALRPGWSLDDFQAGLIRRVVTKPAHGTPLRERYQLARQSDRYS